jgi:nicotinate phosphoribosyltransferase
MTRPRLPAPNRPARRLDPELFHLPVDRIRAGEFSDKYFLYARDVIRADALHATVTMQVFQKRDALLCGVDEAIATLKLCLSEGYRWEDLEVLALRDGDTVQPWEPVLNITGPYAAFAHLETVYLGVLARGTGVATNTRRVVEAAWPTPVLFFPARHDHWLVQHRDGYAAYIAGANAVSTDAQAAWWGARGVGTVPHAMIAAYGGDTVRAVRAFAAHAPADVNIVALVDFENDSARTAVEVARALGNRLWGVRLDTSETLVDRSILDVMGGFKPTGVNPELVTAVRKALDAAGFSHVRIVASGGFDAGKIREFRRQGVPVDSYGVGSSLFRKRYDFTADVVCVGGAPLAKVGRRYRESARVERVE